MLCQPAFDYGRAGHQLEIRKNEALFVSQGKDKTVLRLRSSVPLEEENGAVATRFCLRTCETAQFILEDGQRPDSPSQTEGYASSAFKETLNFWRTWVAHCAYRGRWREYVHRSALALKLMSSRKHGSFVAAPTFGLPEQIGGERNWDYRYAWIRDAAFIVYDLMRLGYQNEATAFIQWIEARCEELRPDGSLQIMYGLDGHHDLAEEELKHLEGYRKSSPIRIGNAAYDQIQLDIHGELLDAIYFYDRHAEPISNRIWNNVVKLTDWVCRHWRRADHGIWEIRGERKEFLYSRIMCWVAIDRALRIARHRSFPAPLDRWTRVRDKIYADIFKRFWNSNMKCFVQHKDSKTVDASCLLMPMVGFIAPKDPFWLSTLDWVNRELVEDSTVHRYRIGKAAPDGLEGEEGTFSMCTFWYIECLARSGDVERARFIFEKMLGYANHTGLYAEQLGAQGEHLGNFPQGFTHLGLIRAVLILNDILSETQR
jgi:GH15 family glucan-1,4-alpha-glucosidase